MTPAVKALPLQQNPSRRGPHGSPSSAAGPCLGTQGWVGVMMGGGVTGAGCARCAPRDATPLAAPPPAPSCPPWGAGAGVRVAVSPPGQAAGAPTPGEGSRVQPPRLPLDRAPSSAFACAGGEPSCLAPPCLSPCMSLVPSLCPSRRSQPQPGKRRSRDEELSGAPAGSWLILRRSVARSCCSRTNTSSYSPYVPKLH